MLQSLTLKRSESTNTKHRATQTRQMHNVLPKKRSRDAKARMSRDTTMEQRKAIHAMQYMCVCVCVNSTSGGEETPATPANQGWLACVPLPLGAAVNKIKGATLTPPNAQARALPVSASPAPGIGVQSLSSSLTIAGSIVCVEGGQRPLSLAKPKSID
jgi:hypothetical protein